MNYFLKANKNLLTYSLIILIVIPIFGINFFISFLGNILLLLLLIPLILLILDLKELKPINIKANNRRGIKNKRSRIFPIKLMKKFNPKIGITISIINE